MKTYVVQLENHDDVISARDKISWSKAPRVLLVWPRRGRVLQRSVDLLLILRHCQHLGAQLAIVTANGEVKSNAYDLGISTFASAEQAQQTNWRRTRGAQSNNRLATRRVRPPAVAQALRELREQFQSIPVQSRRLRLALFTAGVLAFLTLVIFFAPGATITLTPAQKNQQISLPVWAQSAIQAANPSGGMPARSLSVVVEGRDQINSSGRMRVPDGFASGQIALTNLTGQVVEIPAGSIVLTTGADPIRFTTTHSAQVPAGLGMTHTVIVTAVLPGQDGNVAAGQIRAMEGTVGLQVVVENPQPASGGSDRYSPAPTLLDAQNLREKLLASLEKMALEELHTKSDPRQLMVDGSLRVRTVLEEYRDPAQDQPADVLQLTLRVEYEAWYVEEADVQAIAQAALDANRHANYQPVPGSLIYQLKMQPTASPGNLLGANFQGQLTAERRIKAVWSDYATIQAITGRRLADAAMILKTRLELTAAPAIEIYPSWWRRLPFLPARISLVEP